MSRTRAAKLMLAALVLTLPGCTCENVRVFVPASIANDGTTLFDGDNAVLSRDGDVVAFEATGPSEDFQAIPSAERWKYQRGQIYVHVISQSRTELVSLSNAGGPTDARSFNPSISHDGRYVAFQTNAENLRAEFAAEGWNYPASPQASFQMQTYVRDRANGRTHLVSQRPNYSDQVLFYTYNATMMPGSGRVAHFATQFSGSPSNILATQSPGASQGARYDYLTQSAPSSASIEQLSLSVSDDGQVVFNSGEGVNPVYPTLFLGSLSSTTITPVAYPANINVGGIVHNVVSYLNPDISANGEHLVFEGGCQSNVTSSVRSLVLRRGAGGAVGIVSRRGSVPERYVNSRNPAVASTGDIVLESDGGEGPLVSRPYQVYLIPVAFQAGAFTPVSAKRSGGGYVFGDAASYNPDISDDGKRVVFTSEASNLLGASYVRRSGGKYVVVSYIRRICTWAL